MWPRAPSDELRLLQVLRWLARGRCWRLRSGCLRRRGRNATGRLLRYALQLEPIAANDVTSHVATKHVVDAPATLFRDGDFVGG